jgi:hypothetical protein
MNIIKIVLYGVVVWNSTVLWGMMVPANYGGYGDYWGAEDAEANQKWLAQIKRIERRQDPVPFLRLKLDRQANMYVKQRHGKITIGEAARISYLVARIDYWQSLELELKRKLRRRNDRESSWLNFVQGLATGVLENTVIFSSMEIAETIGEVMGYRAAAQLYNVALWTYGKISSHFISEEEFKKREATARLDERTSNLYGYLVTVFKVLSPYSEECQAEGIITEKIYTYAQNANLPPELRQKANEVINERRIKALIKNFEIDIFAQEAAEAFKIDSKNSGRSSSAIKDLRDLLVQGPPPLQQKSSLSDLSQV